MRVELVKSFYFEAAHRRISDDPKKSRVHGHSYVVDIVVEGDCDTKLGWLIDYGEIASAFTPIFDQMDHHFLNETMGAEDLSLPDIRSWIWTRMQNCLPFLKDVRVSIVGDCRLRISEMPTHEAESDPVRNGRGAFHRDRTASSNDAIDADDLSNALSFTFESAHALPRLPETHKCRRLHGHSFRVAISSSNLARLQETIPALYDELDHHCLNELPGLENATSENLSRWIWDWLNRRDAAPSAIVVAETCTARCVYRGL